MDLTFYSKVDTWLVVIYLMLTLIILYFLAKNTKKFTKNSSFFIKDILYRLIILIVLILFIWLPFFNTKYIVNSKGVLIIKSGMFSWNINTKSISFIGDSNKISSAPALSLDRLILKYDNNGRVHKILISPKNKESFIKAIELSRK